VEQGMTMIWVNTVIKAVTALVGHFHEVTTKPSLRLREFRSDVSEICLANRAFLFCGRHDEATRTKLLNLATSLQVAADAVFPYAIWRYAYGLPLREAIQEACMELNGLSQRFPDGIRPSQAREREQALERIEKLLNISTRWQPVPATA
jgi:hypothetical protein